jgi:SnoaL-like domain
VSSATDLETRLRRLEDAEAIRNLKMAYAKLCDEGYDARGIVDLFAKNEDVEWVSDVFGTHVGREGIFDWFENVDEEIQWALHLMINPVVELGDDGRTAKGRFYLLELATMSAPDSEEPDAVIMTGKYADDFVKEDGEWRFKRIEVNFEQVSNLDQGWVKQQFRGRG